MNTRAHPLMMPWARQANLYCAPRRLVITLALGETPDDIPSAVDVRLGAAAPAARIDGGGPVDRLLKRHGGQLRAVRVHAAASSLHVPGCRHQRFNDLEHTTGLARQLRVDLAETCSITDLAETLAEVSYVEQATPYYLCSVPFEAVPQSPIDLERAWRPREQVGLREALAYEPGDPTIIIAIVDTGVMADHPELARKLRPGYDTVEIANSDLAQGVQLIGDVSGPDTNPTDEVGHGTACAGIVGAHGEQIPPGLAGDCQVLPMRVLGAARVVGKQEPIGLGALVDIDAGVKRAIDLGARIINMSFGTPRSALGEHAKPPHEPVVRYGLARGCIMVAASGNSGNAETYYPAALDGVITVGSVDDEDRPSHFCTTGSHVDLCAPGERILSTGLHGCQFVTGTSFAAPFVSAAAALLLSRAQRRADPIEPRRLSALLRAAARPWRAGSQPGCGTGILDVHAALRLSDAQLDHPEPPDSPPTKRMTK